MVGVGAAVAADAFVAFATIVRVVEVRMGKKLSLWGLRQMQRGLRG